MFLEIPSINLAFRERPGFFSHWRSMSVSLYANDDYCEFAIRSFLLFGDMLAMAMIFCKSM
jgi:hypothetical protein